MQLTNMILPRAEWEFTDTPLHHGHLDGDACALCAATGVHQVIRAKDLHGLYEATYKDIAGMIDGNFLNQKVRADALTGIELTGFDDDTMRFIIKSSEFEKNRIKYMCSIQFVNWDEVGQDPDFNFSEKARLLFWTSDLKMHCTCPSFLFHGYEYLLTQIDAAIYPEDRKPVIRNPSELGIICKHLNRLLRHFPFWIQDVASELKHQYGGR